MRYRLTATVEGSGVTHVAFQCTTERYRFGVEVKSGGARITDVWAEAPIVDYRTYLPQFAINTDGVHSLDFLTPPIKAELTRVLQYVESIGSFWMGVTRIRWADARYSWEPDSEAERTELQVFSFSTTFNYPETSVLVKPDVVARMLGMRGDLEYLVIPMSFFREGRNDYRVHRYVPAFYNFYFFLEDLYGGGKTKNRHVVEAFMRSPQLMAAIERARQRLLRQSPPHTLAILQALCTRLNCDFTVEGLAPFLVAIRGELHHFSQQSTRPKGHPLNQERFQPVAFFALVVCMELIVQLANGVPQA